MRASQALKRFEEFLREKRLRMTTQRKAILLLAWDTHEHFSADEIFGWVREQDAAASRATVYRTLSLLVEGGFLASLTDAKGMTLYEHILGHTHHDHMVCLDCGRIIEFRNSVIEEQQEQVAEKHRFQLVRHELRLEGYCGACRAQEQQQGAGASSDGP